MHSNTFRNIHFSNVCDATVNIFVRPVFCVCSTVYAQFLFFVVVFFNFLIDGPTLLLLWFHTLFKFSQKFHFNLRWFDLFSPLLILVCLFLLRIFLSLLSPSLHNGIWVSSPWLKRKTHLEKSHCWIARNDLSLIMRVSYMCVSVAPLSIVIFICCC